jgi:regulator of RNase E activity RraA
MGWGTVPGHGPFLMRSVGKTLTVGQMEVATGDIIFADTDGATKVCTSRRTACKTRALLCCSVPCPSSV